MVTKIEWVARPGTIPESWSPVTGCTRISEGCRNCWAERMARRLAGRFGYHMAPRHFGVTLHPGRLDDPMRWRKPRTVFVVSMGDLFHSDVPFTFITEVFSRMAVLESHTFLVLTKRPLRMLNYFEFWAKYLKVDRVRPLPNVWLGVTAENQKCADERIPILLQIPAAVRFVSCEPLLGAVDFSWAFNGWHSDPRPAECDPGIDWVIVGGESGPGARPMHPQWAREIRDQCKAAGVAFFFKQWGEWQEAPRSQEASWKYQLSDKYETILFMDDGRVINYDHGHTKVGSRGYQAMVRVGKKRAGHLLDGEEWHQWPA